MYVKQTEKVSFAAIETQSDELDRLKKKGVFKNGGLLKVGGIYGMYKK